jgi:glucosylceramidase
MPGALRIESSSYEAQALETVAFVNPDGSHVLVVWNGSGRPLVSVSWRGQGFTYDVPAQAVSTFRWTGSH